MKTLKIQDKNGIYQTADLSDETFVMNFNVSDIGELNKRKVNLSLTIKLPITDKNCHILEFMHIPDVVTNIRNKVVNCYLEEDGAVLAGLGSIMNFSDVENNHINCQITSGIITFTDKLDEKELSSVDLGEIQWNNYGMDGNDQQQNNVFYGLAEFSKNTRLLTSRNDNIFNTKYALPFIKINHVIEKITEELGYTLNYRKPRRRQEIEVLRIGNYQKADNSFEPLMGEGTFSGGYTETREKNIQWLNIRNSTISNFGRNEYFKYKAYNDITVSGGIDLEISTSGRQYDLIILQNEVQVFSERFDGTISKTYDFGTQKVSNSKTRTEFKMSQDEEINVKIGIYTPVHNTITYTTKSVIYEVRHTDTEKQSVPYGGIIPISSNLGFETCLDFYKFYMKLYGYIMHVDERRKVVYLKTYKDVWDNKSANKEWTEKLDYTKTKQSFVNKNYGQNNIIDLQADSNEYKQQAEFTVADQTLSKEKTLFSLPVKSCFSVVRQGLTVAKIDDIDSDDSSESNIRELNTSIDTTKPVCCTIFEGQDIAMNYRFDLEDIVAGSVGLAVIEPLKLQDIINEQYDVLINNMLNNALIIKAKMYLTAKDIEIYNSTINGVPQCFVPVYLNQIGKYFYINSIKNFATNRLSDVELVRISGALGDKSTYLQISRNNEIIYSTTRPSNPTVVVGADAQTLTFNIESTVSWVVSQNNAFAPMSPTYGGTGETQVTVSLPAVTQDTIYTYTIKYGGIEVVLTIRQILGYRVTVSSTPNGTATANGNTGTVIVPIGGTVTLNTTNSDSSYFFGYWIVNGVYYFGQSFSRTVTEDLNAVAYWFDSSKYHKLYCYDENTTCSKDNITLPNINGLYWIVETGAEHTFTNYQTGTLSGYLFRSENYYRNPYTSFSKQINADDIFLEVFYDKLLINVQLHNKGVNTDTDGALFLYDGNGTEQLYPIWEINQDETKNYRISDILYSTPPEFDITINFPPAPKGEWKLVTDFNIAYFVTGDTPFNYTGTNNVPNIFVEIENGFPYWYDDVITLNNGDTIISVGNTLDIPDWFNGIWDITTDNSDCVPYISSGTVTGINSIAFRLAANTTASSRTIRCYATFTRNDGVKSIIGFRIIQPNFNIGWDNEVIEISDSSQVVNNILNVPTGTTFQITSDTFGVEIAPSLGSGTQNISFNIPANSDVGVEKNTKITALIDGELYDFYIIQSAPVIPRLTVATRQTGSVYGIWFNGIGYRNSIIEYVEEGTSCEVRNSGSAVFLWWEDSAGNIVSYDQSYTFTMPSTDYAIYARFIDTTVQKRIYRIDERSATNCYNSNNELQTVHTHYLYGDCWVLNRAETYKFNNSQTDVTAHYVGTSEMSQNPTTDNETLSAFIPYNGSFTPVNHQIAGYAHAGNSSGIINPTYIRTYYKTAVINVAYSRDNSSIQGRFTGILYMAKYGTSQIFRLKNFTDNQSTGAFNYYTNLQCIEGQGTSIQLALGDTVTTRTSNDSRVIDIQVPIFNYGYRQTQIPLYLFRVTV